jgi:signal transduction histidine kinase/ligand-binding sensor domain-containing protein
MLKSQVILDPILNPDHVKIHQIRPEEGMSGPYLHSAFQDQYGYIWIGSENGVDVYDGYKFRNIRIRESDSTSSQLIYVFHFADDKDGGVWMCSVKGLYYYDRSKDALILQMKLPDFPEEDRKTVLGIFPDKRGLYWIFTSHGLLQYERAKDQIIHTEIPLSRSVWVAMRDFNLLERDDGSVWIPADPNGLFKYLPETGGFINYRHDPDNPNSISSDRVRDILEDIDGNLWITTFGGGLNILNDADQKTFEHVRHDPGNENSVFSDSLNTMMMDRKGKIWITGIDGFSKYQPDKREFKSYRIKRKDFDFSNPDLRNDIIQINEDPAGHIWFRTRGAQGLFCFNPESEQLYQFVDIQDEMQGLGGGNWIPELFTDRAGLEWAMTNKALNIIEMHPQKSFHLFGYDGNDSGSLSRYPWSIYLDSEGTLWIGSNGAVLNRCVEFRYNLPERFSHFLMYEKLYEQKIITSIIEKDEKNLWIGAWDGLYIFDRGSEKFSPCDQNPILDSLSKFLHIEELYKAKNNFLWIATRNNGLYIYDPESDKLAHYGLEPDDPDYRNSHWVYTFCEDNNGNMWIGYYGIGLSMLTKNEITKIFTSENLEFNRYTRTNGRNPGLSSGIIMKIHQDKRNRIWIGTTAGLNLFNPQNESFYSFHEADGLPNDCIYGILEDNHGNLWISTMKGISKIGLEDGYGEDIIMSTHNYGSYEGIKQPVFNEKSCFKTPDGWMYFGGIYGLTVFHPDSIKENPIIPPVHITNILINDRSITDLDKLVLDESLIETDYIRLPFRQNFLSFEYVALNYLIAEKNQYRYMMEGLDENWVEAGTRRFAEYRDLKPGEYTFRVIASNEDGLWNEEGTSIGIIINPPWYRTVLAYFIYGILFVAAIYTFIRWRTWRLLKDKEILEGEVKQRTRQIANQNEELKQQKEEILTANEELEQQKEELQITLENLKQTQTQLIQSEKLAALGGLVAGVAHEINTPVGISVTAASNMAEETRQMADLYKENKISRADFKEYLNTANQSAKLILSNMEKTASMVQSFKQVSVDQSTEQKREFKLREYTEDVIRSLYPRLKEKKIEITLDIEEKLELDSYPGAYSQILANLLLNSLVHGFSKKEAGEVKISATEHPDGIEITYRDNGIGIPPDNLERIFDPFFTTNKKVGTGLGLHIVYNLVTQKLMGSVNCESKVEYGTKFIIKIPVSQ